MAHVFSGGMGSCLELVPAGGTPEHDQPTTADASFVEDDQHDQRV